MSVIDVNQIIRNFAHDANTLAEAVALKKMIVPRFGESYESLPLILSEIKQDVSSTLQNLQQSQQSQLALAALLDGQKLIGNTSAEAAITAFIDDSLTAQIRADGLEIKGKAQPNTTITVEY